ncbi:hypothetical protein ASPWEDRAFT_116615 [Aspergillus wentii DTO 134E9]|uniref:Major facilitator superfamily (MFS) profile domain-containing protein n=1 Tax=Aspergillus wentii DTO 134E9 TaxID=1073089 RepID=A0A1L9RAX3_ASPWE|nr:uncharacterized protein ASPWEDRAFT_116615 [Aspergillus wentii DTO 134E9]OJJ32007.1 hypothetical protein ASPWEDRAFT_116615 [Aspergillus wentii DTO 134E9]
MASQRALFTASRLQTLTYLLGVCPFSIAFLVFINSSISFVVTDLIGIHDGEGDAVGTLGFADELLALAACPLWGVFSDHIGVRHVCALGYAIIAFALVLLVQAKNVYPELLLGRLLFSVGGSAVSTMVTAVLPAVTGKAPNTQTYRMSLSSETAADSPSSRLAGFVGMCAGCGALVSLSVFLPLPARFENWGSSPIQAIQYSYYLVGVVALLISICCLVGLRDLLGEEDKGWTSLLSKNQGQSVETTSNDQDDVTHRIPQLPYWKQLSTAVVLGFQNPAIGQGYLGGFVARASSVGISLFIPLFVNHYYRVSGLCEENREPVSDIKKSCPSAYILAAILTGVSQLVALIAAPAFGFLSEKSRRYQLPLLFSSLAGIIGYTAFGLIPSPQFKGDDGNPGVFILMALIGLSQIGAIVCSLAVLSNGILSISVSDGTLKQGEADDHTSRTGTANEPITTNVVEQEPGEQQPLLASAPGQNLQQFSHLKGSIAGVYSLYGGVGILLLTKVGGALFDTVSSSAPFFIMTSFNGVLLLAGILGGFMSKPHQAATHAAA